MIYVHVPFCKSFCTYCGFYSETAVCYEAYAGALVREIRERKEEMSATLGVGTVYFGGGTPSVLPLSVFRRIVAELKAVPGVLPAAEFTVEVNPEDIVRRGPGYAEALLELGVNRISMGVQSFDDAVLRRMNRRHDAATAVKAYHMLEDAGFGNISIDLIFGFPAGRGESDALSGWSETLDRALEISGKGGLPKHISAYQLSVEPGSALEKMVESGRFVMAEDEVCAQEYELLCSRLAGAGYNHYEISNFALPGYEAKHNSAYWRQLPYTGLGPGAHSLRMTADGPCRSWNLEDLKGYVASALPDCTELSSKLSDCEILTPEQQALEALMLGLRTAGGVPAELLGLELTGDAGLSAATDSAAFGAAVPQTTFTVCSSEAVAAAIAAGHLEMIQSGNYRIPERFFFISDSIIASLV